MAIRVQTHLPVNKDVFEEKPVTVSLCQPQIPQAGKETETLRLESGI